MFSNLLYIVVSVFCLVLIEQVSCQTVACNRTTIINGICKPVLQCDSIRNLILNNKNSLTEEFKNRIRSYQCIGIEFETIHVCCEKKFADVFPTGYKCGENSEERIIRTHTGLDEHRWLVRLNYEQIDGTTKFGCGGTIIHPLYILTSADCLVGKIENEFGKIKSVRLGEYDILTATDCEDTSFGDLICNDPVVDIDIEKVIPHPDFRQGNDFSQNNIGLIKLSKEIKYTDLVSPICIESNSLLEENAYYPLVSVVGWGQKLNENQFDKKTSYPMQVVENRECKDTQVTDICVKKGPSHLSEPLSLKCPADAGGPLMYPKSTYYVIGIATLSSGCGIRNGTTKYTKVKPYVNWIISNINY